MREMDKLEEKLHILGIIPLVAIKQERGWAHSLLFQALVTT
jgi:hypothetical protein